MKSTDFNADMVWPQVGLPKHCRSACRAEMHPNLSSLLPVADIDFGRSFGANSLLLEKGDNVEHRPGLPLTLATMADAYSIRISGYLDAQGTTRATRGSGHDILPYQFSETTGVPLSGRRAYVAGGRPWRWWSMLGAVPSQGCIDSSQIESLAGGNADVSNAPTATPQTAGLRSPSQ